MYISQQGIDLLKELEGFCAEAYKDSGGIWTIGYGTTGDWITDQSKITKEDAEKLLRHDIARCETALQNNVKVHLDQTEFDALCCFIYNVGVQAFKDSTLLKIVNQAHFDQVPAQLRRWNKVKGEINKGLINRREKEIELWNQPSPTILQQTKTWFNHALNVIKTIK